MIENDVHWIQREIGIDMGHRVTYHGSKCKNIHGHRYTIRAMCEGPLFESGEQQGMVLDFGFLKEEMMEVIDKDFDHGMCLWIDDPIFRAAVTDKVFNATVEFVRDQGYYLIEEGSAFFGKLYIIPFVPTAENLVRHWFRRLKPRIEQRSNGKATLKMIKAWETPNCSATYFEGNNNESFNKESALN